MTKCWFLFLDLSLTVRDWWFKAIQEYAVCLLIISVSTVSLRLCSQSCSNRALVSSSGLDSDESCEGGSESSFKDALADGGSQKNNGSVPRKNGMKKHRYCCIPALRMCWSQVKAAPRSCLGHRGSLEWFHPSDEAHSFSLFTHISTIISLFVLIHCSQVSSFLHPRLTGPRNEGLPQHICSLPACFHSHRTRGFFFF